MFEIVSIREGNLGRNVLTLKIPNVIDASDEPLGTILYKNVVKLLAEKNEWKLEPSNGQIVPRGCGVDYFEGRFDGVPVNVSYGARVLSITHKETNNLIGMLHGNTPNMSFTLWSIDNFGSRAQGSFNFEIDIPLGQRIVSLKNGSTRRVPPPVKETPKETPVEEKPSETPTPAADASVTSPQP